MERKKTLLGSGMALALLVVAGFGLIAYSMAHTPRALAEQVAAKSINLIEAASTNNLAKIEAQFGGNPTQDLKTAKQAKDLTVITQQELDQETSKTGGLIAVTLDASGKPTVVSGSFGLPNGGRAGFVGASAQAAIGAPTTNSVTSASVPVSNGSAQQSGTTCMTASNVNGVATTNSVPCPSGPPPGAIHSGDPTMANGPVTEPAPAKYLRYTDTSGRVVVLGLDAQGVPIRKITLMTAAEAQQLAPNPAQ